MHSKILLELYRQMLKIRLIEKIIASLQLKNEINGAIHLCIGQEAIAAGVCVNLRKDDLVFSNHRGHGHYIAKGGSMRSLFAELFGRSTGCSKGKGGSMHLVDTSVGYIGSSSIVAGNIPISVGAALALKSKRSKNIAVCFFGDGAVDEGVFYESLNFAALKNLPVLFVCENNFYAICSHQLKRQRYDNIVKKTKVFGVPGKSLDGNDVLEVYAEVKKIISNMRNGMGPYLIECRTYRWMGHAGPKEDLGLGYRSKHELDLWKARCPIKRLKRILFGRKLMNENICSRINSKILKEIEEAVSFARKSPSPTRYDLSKDVTSGRKIKLCV